MKEWRAWAPMFPNLSSCLCTVLYHRRCKPGYSTLPLLAAERSVTNHQTSIMLNRLISLIEMISLSMRTAWKFWFFKWMHYIFDAWLFGMGKKWMGGNWKPDAFEDGDECSYQWFNCKNRKIRVTTWKFHSQFLFIIFSCIHIWNNCMKYELLQRNTSLKCDFLVCGYLRRS